MRRILNLKNQVSDSASGGGKEHLLQRVDGSVWRVNLFTGEVKEAPAPAKPMIPMGELFADEEEERASL